MHVAASNPQAADAASLDPAAVRREKDVMADKYRQQASRGDDREIVESAHDLLQEVTMLEQPFIHDSGKSVAQAVKEAFGPGRRPYQGRGLCALCSRRGNREAGVRFRRRSGRRRRTGVTAAGANRRTAALDCLVRKTGRSHHG